MIRHAAPLLLLLCACTASMVQKPGRLAADPNAPVNEAARPGVIKFLNEGIDTVRDKRRANAYAQMQKACDGPYRIDAEGPQLEGAVVIPGDVTTVVQSQYWYIQFSCVRS